MSELLKSGELGGLIFWGAIVLICVVPTIAHYWRKNRQAELDAGLKRQMLERGMSAEDIRSVLEASSQTRQKPSSDQTKQE
jgi:hypothetical protein